MSIVIPFVEARSGVHSSNLQEIMEAGVSAAHSLQHGQNQYTTPKDLAKVLAGLLPRRDQHNVLDPQCAQGNLINAVNTNNRFGTEIDNRLTNSHSGASVIFGNCVKTFETFDELFPDDRFACIVANPPFGIRWKLADGTTIDSTQWTWDLMQKRLAPYGGCGFLISNADTLEKFGIADHSDVYLYQRFPAGGIWDNCSVELGVVHFQKGPRHRRHVKIWDHVPSNYEIASLATQFVCGDPQHTSTGTYTLRAAWKELGEIVEDERSTRSKYNIYLSGQGMLKTYLSHRNRRKINHQELTRLFRINDCHPLTLTTERETRKLLHSFLVDGTYTIEPAAKAAINSALAEVASLACPIRPVTDFELVAYADEEDHLICKAAAQDGGIQLTPGKKYEINTGTYTFKDKFTRKKLHYDQETNITEIEDHDCELSGEDRYVELTDDLKRIHRFMDRPDRSANWQHDEGLLWQLFKAPYVPTVAEVETDRYEKNIELMRFNGMVAGFNYYDGQLDYYARMGCKDYGLIAAATGTGKTLGALTMVALKTPKRTLIIAPQGTMRSSGDEDEIDYQASQWVQEIVKFAPTEPVFQLFSEEDWRHILKANGGELPPGIYITYPQAYFSNNSFENLPNSWEFIEEKKFCERYRLPYDEKDLRPGDQCFHRNVGASNDKGIRCIAEPSLATQIACRHGEAWECVILDEAHLCCNLDAQITQKLIRLQPKYRYAMTATPIPNIVSNLFSLMGWVCVKDWYKGNIRNAAWPYAVDEKGRFDTTFLSTEIDLTAQEKARAKGKKSWRSAGTRHSPIISSPARLLKLLKPNMAYISKEDCNPKLVPCEVHDVRVALGKDQAKLYAFWLDRGNYLEEFKNPLTIAQVQSNRLRGICAAPASLDYNRGMARSNFNPKQVMVLQLIRDILRRGEQVTVVSARVGQSEALARRLAECGITISRIDSTVKSEFHTAEANRFKRGDARVMLMGIKCAQAHSFHLCSNLIVGSLEWSYGTLNQAQGRVWRLNSPQPVKVWVVLHKNTIEELLFDRVALKQDSATLCLHGKRVPRDFKTLDASEVLAEHIVNYDAGAGEILSESECESQWNELKKHLMLSNHRNEIAA